MQFNSFEKEVLLLYATALLTDEMANKAIVVPPSRPGGPARFNGFSASHLFFIWLVDFLSPSDDKVFGEKNPYLRGLCELEHANHFDNQTGAAQVASTSQDFRRWLRTTITLKDWYWGTSLDLQHDLRIERFDLVTLYGNIQKHNFSRLGSAAERIREILEANGHRVRFKDALLAIEDFDFQMSEGFNLVDYYASTLIEFVLNIRWAIQDYLQPFYLRCKKNKPDGGYKYQIPTEIDDDFAETCFWNLMNIVRREPILEKFRTPPELRSAY